MKLTVVQPRSGYALIYLSEGGRVGYLHTDWKGICPAIKAHMNSIGFPKYLKSNSDDLVMRVIPRWEDKSIPYRLVEHKGELI